MLNFQWRQFIGSLLGDELFKLGDFGINPLELAGIRGRAGGQRISATTK